MPEIVTPLRKLVKDEAYLNATGEDVFVITDDHTHADIMRFVAADIGKGEAMMILRSLD